MATYGSFPGVEVTTESGGITNVAIGEEEKLVFFGETNYTFDDDSGSNTFEELLVDGDDDTLDVSANEPEQINAPRVADLKFGSDSELSNAMKEALGNGANIDFLYGVSVGRDYVEAESQGTQTGTVNNVELVENTGFEVNTQNPTRDVDGDGNDETSYIGNMGIRVDDVDGTGTVQQEDVNVELRYDGAPGTPSTPTDDTTDVDEVWLNPLTGEYAADQAPTDHFEFYYTYNQYTTAFEASGPQNVVNEDETGIFFALTDSDNVSSSLNGVVSDLRDDYQLVNALSFAEPNANELLDSANTDIENGGADARFDASNYSSANNSISEAYYYKFAPGRLEDVDRTIGGGLGGLFAGNPINDPIYNEVLSGYQSLEQQFSKTDADNMRDEDIIPIRSGGNVRVKGNRSTAFDPTIDSVAADFWTRRITDRVILIGKQIGDAILGRINDEETRDAAERRISQEMRQLEGDRLIRPNTTDETNWTVTAYEDQTNDDQVNIDIAFSPYGIVKNVDETITVNTN